MQKFTRALTREIEVNGERLAITLNEAGVSVRSVGSRKSPAEIAWAAVVAAARSQPSMPVDAATPSPEAMNDLADLLQRLDAWLAKHRSSFHAGLLPGASAETIDHLAKALRRPVPPELAVWLRWHNGQAEDAIGSLVGAFNVIDAEEIAAEDADRQARAVPGPWNDGWVPLLDDFNGNLICLDTIRPGAPVIELWNGMDRPEDAAPSLAAWVTALLADLEAGRYVEDPERGEMIRKS